MKVFVSWSGTESQRVAVVIHDWLPSVLPYVKPWISSEDISKGARWASVIAAELEASNYCIVCVTPDVARMPWVNFEAGAIAKIVSDSRVSPLLVGTSVEALRDLPLGMFQATRYEKADVRRLLESIDSGAENPSTKGDLRNTFDQRWRDLEKAIDPILQTLRTKAVDTGNAGHADPVGGIASQVTLSDDAEELLLAATSKDDDAHIMRLRTMGGVSITAGGRDFVTDRRDRTSARWEGALDELLDQSLVRSYGQKDQVFRVTRAGFELADTLRGSPATDEQPRKQGWEYVEHDDHVLAWDGPLEDLVEGDPRPQSDEIHTALRDCGLHLVSGEGDNLTGAFGRGYRIVYDVRDWARKHKLVDGHGLVLLARREDSSAYRFAQLPIRRA